MPTCFVPGCTSGYSSNKNNTDRHFFSAPKDATLRSLWNKAIPRADKELSPDKELFFLVTRMHFYSRFLQRERALNVQVKSARKRAKLL